MNDERYDLIMISFEKRYRLKKSVNLCISCVTALLGITSFIYGLRYESIRTIFRWMTIDGTLFTTLVAIAFIAVNIYELTAYTEMTLESVYYIRLSSVVAETVILAVVLFSHTPFISEHIPLTGRYDYLAMHLLIPVLSIASFLTNDSPIGKLRRRDYWRGTWFVTCYAVTVVILIAANILSEAEIPYYFLDYRKHAGSSAFALVFIYGVGYFMSRTLSEWNRKLSWLWFKNITSGNVSDKPGG